MTLRFRTSLLLLLVLASTACDPLFAVVVTVPVARPVSESCAKLVFDSIARPPRNVPSDPQGPPRRSIAFVDGIPYGGITQHENSDSTAALERSIGRFGPNGGRFSKTEVDTIAKELSAALTHVRDACGGVAPTGAPPYKVKQRPL